MRYDTNGDTLWTRNYGDSTYSWNGWQVKQTLDGGYLIVGYTTSGYEDACAIKTDAQGNEQWRHTYGLDGIVIDAFTASVELPDGYLLTGISYPQVDNSEMYAVRVDTAGTEVWTHRWGGAFDDLRVHACLSQDGTVILSGGYGYASDLESMKPYLAKMDPSDGSLVWAHQYGAAMFSTTLFAGKECPDGDIIACGVSYNVGQQQGLLLRTATNGDSLWMRNYAFHDSVIDQGSGRFWDVLPTPDGGLIAAGDAYQPFNAPYPPGYSADAWVVKVDSMGCIVPGCQLLDGITEQFTNLGDALTLYPNPVHAELHVGIKLPKDLSATGPLMLSVTSLDGKLVLQRQVPTSSWHSSPLSGRGTGGAGNEVVLDVSSLAAGAYSLHLSDATRWLAGKKLLVE